MDETTYHRLADAALQQIMERIETQDARGEVDCELAGGVLTIEFPSGKQIVVNKQAPARQVWFASPGLGGLHFSYDESKRCWVLADGRELQATLDQEALRHSKRVGG